MNGVLDLVDSASALVTAACAAFGLFFLARQNGLLRQQLARPDPIVSVDAHRIDKWTDDRWRMLTVSVRNPSLVPLHVTGLEIVPPGKASLWFLADGYEADYAGGRRLRTTPPEAGGAERLAFDFEVLPAGSDPERPGPRRKYAQVMIRRERADQPWPNVRLTCRWKTNKATTMAIVADIWERDAAV